MMAIKTSGAGDPLVLLHGVNTTHAIWRRVCSRLASTRLVVTPDLPGFGEPAPVRPGFALDQVADALAEELSRVAAPFDLLGHSLGGAVALTLAHRQRDLVRRLVLAAPAGFSPQTWLVANVQGHAYAAGVDIRDFVSRPMVRTGLGRRLLFGMVVADASALEVKDAQLMLEASRGGTRVREAVIAVQSADLRPLLAKLHIPLGFLWGERDSLVGFNILKQLRLIAPAAQIETIANAGHVPQIERPAAFVAGVEALLARL
jgi:pimeloyl-ACP methyl ester carboxylesterase